MNAKPITDAVENLKDRGRAALDSLQEKAGDSIVDPLVEAGKTASGAIRRGAHDVADYSRHAAKQTGEWITGHPASSAGIFFAAGLIIGAAVVLPLRKS